MTMETVAPARAPMLYFSAVTAASTATTLPRTASGKMLPYIRRQTSTIMQRTRRGAHQIGVRTVSATASTTQTSAGENNLGGAGGRTHLLLAFAIQP